MYIDKSNALNLQLVDKKHFSHECLRHANHKLKFQTQHNLPIKWIEWLPENHLQILAQNF